MKKVLICLMLGFVMILSACSSDDKTITFADAGWDSIQFHNAVAGFIAVEAFGYEGYKEVRGSTPITHEGLLQGQIDVHMEEWSDNIPSYQKDVDAGLLIDLGINFDDNYQGLYVPRYVIEGDSERGIQALAPELKTVEDLKKYASIFKDGSGLPRIYGAIPGWEVDQILHRKYLAYNLNEYFEYFRPGSDAALSAVLSDAYLDGKPIVGYYWEPTWMLGKYDFVLLEDNPYTTKDDFQAGLTEMPPMDIRIAVSLDFHEKDPEFCEFLSKYQTSSAMISEALAYSQDNNVDFKETAKWFLNKYDNLLDQWLDSKRAEKVREALV
jgi:glycine betaine/proline transport system substrate-binding protein